MKKTLLSLVLAIFCLCAITLHSCKQESSKSESDKTETVEEKGKEYTSKYICPMHCEGSGSDIEGTCPVCGMDYVLNEDYKEMHDDHDHSGHDHDGHDHNHDHD